MTDLTLAKAWHKFFIDKVEAIVDAENRVEPDELGQMCDDSRCQLGQWIYSGEHHMQGVGPFEMLKKAHAGFHQHVRDYVTAHLSGDAQSIRESRADFRNVSNAVLSAIDDLKEFVVAARKIDADAYPLVTISELREVKWDDSLNTGIPIIDEQHRTILKLVTYLQGHEEMSLHSQVAIDFLSNLGRILELHFTTEESWMKKLNVDPQEQEAHRQMHQNILVEYTDLNYDLMLPSSLKIRDVAATIRKWVIDHAVECDINLRKYLLQRS